jgi:hypothetical protein
MAIEPTVPLVAGAYLREFEAQIDVPAPGRLRVIGRLRDALGDIEHTWLVATPTYEVLEAGARQHAGEQAHIAPALCARYSTIAGVGIGRGFSRRIRTALGEDLPGAGQHLLLAIEMARVGQQVFQFSPEFEQRFAPQRPLRSADALLAWRKDRDYMAGLAGSCYTYRDESEALFATRRVISIVGPPVTRPAPGTLRAFWRRKRLSIRRSGAPERAYVCESAMEDTLHDITIGFRLDHDGRIGEANSGARRLPYSGLCEDPHERVAGLNGVRITEQYVSQLSERIGGSQGCAHLFDLAVDCLRLFRY